MHAKWVCALVLIVAGWSTPSFAEKSTSECLDITDKYIKVLGDITLREAKPKGACALAQFGVRRHQDVLRQFSAEPDECRKSNLGKNLENTLKTRINQESRLAKRHCRR